MVRVTLLSELTRELFYTIKLAQHTTYLQYMSEVFVHLKREWEISKAPKYNLCSQVRIPRSYVSFFFYGKWDMQLNLLFLKESLHWDIWGKLLWSMLEGDHGYKVQHFCRLLNNKQYFFSCSWTVLYSGLQVILRKTLDSLTPFLSLWTMNCFLANLRMNLRTRGYVSFI